MTGKNLHWISLNICIPQVNINDCRDSPCSNGGTCHDLIGTYKCSCPPGTSGALCEENEDNCAPEPCFNGGTCRDLINGFECNCPPGFVGAYCQGVVNSCLNKPCDPAGTHSCVPLLNDFRCECKEGFQGRQQSSLCTLNWFSLSSQILLYCCLYCIK